MTKPSGVLLFLASLTLSSGAWSQTTDTILSGRPGVSIPPYVVGTGVVQLQSGLDYLKTENNSFVETTQSNHFFRMGFTEWFETNLLVNLQSDLVSDPNLENRQGLSQLVPGARFNIIDEKSGWIQGLGLQVDFSMKDVGEDYAGGLNTPGLTLVSYHELNSTFNFTANFGATHDSDIGLSSNYRLALGFALLDNLGGFFEIYGFENEQDGDHFFDFGFGYIINKDLQFDMSAGYGNNDGIADIFVSTGLSLRTTVF